MDKRSIAKTVLIGLALLFLGVAAGAARDQANPSVEPFYLRLLKTGETFYAAANYAEAVSNLRIAAFGLFGDKALLSRAQAYLGLSLVKSGDKEAGRELIEKALATAGSPDKIESLGLAAAAQNDLLALMKAWKIPTATTVEKPPVAAPDAEPARKIGQDAVEKAAEGKTAADYAAAASPGRIRELEEILKLDSRKSAAYFELANLHLQSGNRTAAKAVLKSLIKENPAEIEGLLALARIFYEEKSYKETDAHLEKFLGLASATGLGRERTAEAQALRLLAAQLRGDAKTLRKLLPEYRDALGEETIDALPLSPEDKIRLRSILQNGK